MSRRLGRPAAAMRARIGSSTTELFSHTGYPLANSLSYMGDPGLFGPESMTWPIIGDVSSFIGGIRALLIQATHPEVVSGVFDHSRYRDDPLGRLSRTSAYVTATAYGAVPEARQAIEKVRKAHKLIRGRSHRGASYSADAPELAAWVHNALTDSFLVAYEVFGPQALARSEADRFVSEQAGLGRRHGADPLPETAAELSAWLASHPAVGPSPGMADAVAFLSKPPLTTITGTAYGVLYRAAVATLPAPLRQVLSMRSSKTAIPAGMIMSRFLRWALGSSPSWRLALVRTRTPVPEGRFLRMPPVVASSEVDRR